MAENKKPFDFRSLSPKAKKPDFGPADFELDVGRRVLPAPEPVPAASAAEAKPEQKPSPSVRPSKKAKAPKAEKPAAAAGEGGQGLKVVVMGRSGEAGGRPTFKAPNTECVKVTLLLPLETKRMMQKALAGEFFGKFRSNVELVDAAIRTFITNGGK